MENHTVDSRGRPRVVITGMGAITPIGNSVAESWESVLNGRSGIDHITQFDASHLPVRFAGEVKGFEPKDYIPHREVRRMSRCSQLAVGAARQALDNAGFNGSVPDPERSGVIVGTAMGGYEKADENTQVFRNKGLNRVTPFALISTLPNMPGHHVSVMARTLGPLNTVVSACATGTQAIGEAADYIRYGRADMMIAGGVEAVMHETAIAGFSAMRGLANSYNDDPTRASRPFNLDREGFVYSEGVGIVILERLDHALARGATILAEVLGHAASSDAFHVAALDPEGAGPIRCMRWALDDSGIEAEAVDYINAHGTSTPANDAMETKAIKRVFGEEAYSIPVSSTKALTGHMMGGSGAVEAILTISALQAGILPPTWNYETPDPECDLDYVPNAPRAADLRVALSNSFGLGGQNACIVLGKYSNGRSAHNGHIKR